MRGDLRFLIFGHNTETLFIYRRDRPSHFYDVYAIFGDNMSYVVVIVVVEMKSIFLSVYARSV